MSRLPLSLPIGPANLRRIGVVLAVLAIYRLGCWIPLPGVDATALVSVFETRAAIERVSVMGLGVTPWLSVLLLAEFAMIAAPGLRRWSSSTDNEASCRGWILLGTLAMAGFQANGIAVALEQIGTLVAHPGLMFRAVVVASLVGATGLLIWLASLVTRYGLGSGFLLLLAAPHIIDLPGLLAAQSLAWGSSSEVSIPLTLALFVAAAAALITAAGSLPDGDRAGQLLWPPLLAYTAAAWGPVLIVALVARDQLALVPEALKPGTPIRLALLPALTLVFYYLRARSLDRSGGTSAAGPRWIAPVLLAAVVAVCEGMLMFLPAPLVLDGRSVVIIVVFALSFVSIARRNASPPE